MSEFPTNVPATVTRPRKVQAATISAQTGRCNIHLDGDGPFVYVAKPELYAHPDLTLGEKEVRSLLIHQMLCQMATAAKAAGMTVSVTYQGGEEPGSQSPTYWQFELLRLTVEDEAGEGIIPWTNREAASA